MLCRLPIVSTDVGSILEVLHPGKNGILVKTKCSDDIRNAIHELLRDQRLREAYGLFSLNYALENCTIDKMINDMETVFKGGQ